MSKKPDNRVEGLEYCEECKTPIVSLEIHNDFWHKEEDNERQAGNE